MTNKIFVMKSILLLFVCFLFVTKMISQNVGIGITIPSAKLHVNGPVKLEGLNLFAPPAYCVYSCFYHYC
jgi:hypothetical protein